MRLMGKAKGGFYAASPAAVKLAAEFLRPPDGGAGAVTLLDPCAGEGEAVKQLADELGLQPQNVYAVELEEQRAVKVAENLPGANVLGPASFFGTSITSASMSLCWCNPPFDDGDEERVELTFARRVAGLLRPGGVLALVCPEDVADRYDVRRFLAQRFEQLQTVEFPPEHRPFREVIVFGRRREKVQDGYSPDYNEAPAGFRYTLVPGGQVRSWAKTDMTDGELAEALGRSPLKRWLEPPTEAPLPSPPLALATGHVALLLAAGHLDGLVQPPGEPPHVVKGTARKIEYVARVEERESEDGKSSSVTTVYQEKICLTVRELRANGQIETFTQGE